MDCSIETVSRRDLNGNHPPSHITQWLGILENKECDIRNDGPLWAETSSTCSVIFQSVVVNPEGKFLSSQNKQVRDMGRE
ncbi:hypothetical protein JTE90_010318 [Oedothorax gibbosus]|uniref:Uncharacterized protein n=1 Tax=Oedothorax gibbosus TaxID=931172 RepID=A0AAV6V5B0_9ARAC|nr:hypothetical protein JTE90_010318 [Oedothorax gibbosus]